MHYTPVVCASTYADIDNLNKIIVKNSSTATIKDEIFNSIESIIVEENGILIINRTNVYFNNMACNEYGIYLKKNSSLYLYNSELKGLNNLFYFKGNNAKIFISNSRIRGTHILCYEKSNISINGSDLWATHCFNSSTANINNSKLHYLFLTENSVSNISNSHIVEILLYDNSYANVVNTTLKNIFYFDNGWTSLSNCSYVDIIRFIPKKCNLTIGVFENDHNYPIQKAHIKIIHVLNAFEKVSKTNKSGYSNFSNLTEGDYYINIEKEGYNNLKERISILNKADTKTFLLLKKEKAYLLKEKLLIVSFVLIIIAIVYILYKLFRRIN